MLKKIVNNPIIRFLGAIASIIAVIYIFRKELWRLGGGLTNLAGRFANLLVMYWRGLVLVVFAILIFALYLKLGGFKKYVATSFKDDCKKGLHKNWYYIDGRWKLLRGGGLSVTQSEKGGITRVGHLWTDYSFEFTAVIVNLCIGWILRAQDLLNYYMIQLNPTEVRPHLRVGGRWIAAEGKKYGLALDTKKHGVPIRLNEPIKIRTEVRGSEIRVYVNNREIYHDQKFFSIKFINQDFDNVPMQPGVLVVPPFTTGRVGFRMYGQEHGRISRCRVRPG